MQGIIFEGERDERIISLFLGVCKSWWHVHYWIRLRYIWRRVWDTIPAKDVHLEVHDYRRRSCCQSFSFNPFGTIVDRNDYVYLNWSFVVGSLPIRSSPPLTKIHGEMSINIGSRRTMLIGNIWHLWQSSAMSLTSDYKVGQKYPVRRVLWASNRCLEWFPHVPELMSCKTCFPSIGVKHFNSGSRMPRR